MARVMFSHLICTNHIRNWRGKSSSLSKCSRSGFALWFQLIALLHWMRNLQNWISLALLRSGEPVVKPHFNYWLWKTLLLLEIQLLLGCYVKWSVPLPQAGADIDHPVLSTAGNYADADESAEEGGSSGIAASATPPQAAGTQSRGRTGGDAGPDSGRSATSPAAAAQAADPAATAAGVLDVKDFTIWTPSTWELLQWDEIHLPKNPYVSICSVRSYMAITMIIWYQPDLQLTQLRLSGRSSSGTPPFTAIYTQTGWKNGRMTGPKHKIIEMAGRNPLLLQEDPWTACAQRCSSRAGVGTSTSGKGSSGSWQFL